jgi:hypothetical protein
MVAVIHNLNQFDFSFQNKKDKNQLLKFLLLLLLILTQLLKYLELVLSLLLLDK